MQLKIKKLHPDAITPTYATDGSGCFDLYALSRDHQRPVFTSNGVTFRTGIAVEIPPGYVMLIFSRSGHGFKNATRLANCVGVIDSDYRGEVCVRLTRDESCDDVLRVNPGDRIAQALVIPRPRIEFVEVDELGETARGTGGFGSTGS